MLVEILSLNSNDFDNKALLTIQIEELYGHFQRIYMKQVYQRICAISKI